MFSLAAFLKVPVHFPREALSCSDVVRVLLDGDVPTTQNKTKCKQNHKYIAIAPPFVCTAHLAFTLSDINGLVGAAHAQTQKVFHSKREMADAAAGWFVCACVRPMMDAHGC
jgi:hypothetical protein